MTFTAKLLDQSGFLVCSKSFQDLRTAKKAASDWSIAGATAYVFNGKILAVFRSKRKLTVETI
jgi:hypothetical protein